MLFNLEGNTNFVITVKKKQRREEIIFLFFAFLIDPSDSQYGNRSGSLQKLVSSAKDNNSFIRTVPSEIIRFMKKRYYRLSNLQRSINLKNFFFRRKIVFGTKRPRKLRKRGEKKYGSDFHQY